MIAQPHKVVECITIDEAYNLKPGIEIFFCGNLSCTLGTEPIVARAEVLEPYTPISDTVLVRIIHPVKMPDQTQQLICDCRRNEMGRDLLAPFAAQRTCLKPDIDDFAKCLNCD